MFSFLFSVALNVLQKINTGIFSNTYSGSSGGFVRARKTQFTKIVKSTKISKYLWISVKENNWGGK